MLMAVYIYSHSWLKEIEMIYFHFFSNGRLLKIDADNPAEMLIE